MISSQSHKSLLACALPLVVFGVSLVRWNVTDTAHGMPPTRPWNVLGLQAAGPKRISLRSNPKPVTTEASTPSPTPAPIPLNTHIEAAIINHAVGPTSLSPGYVSDGLAGSLLIFNLYTSSPTRPAEQNSRISITNTDSSSAVAVHLFLIDGETCSVSDRFTCLTPSQTGSFLASDFDPGVTGYMMAIAVDKTTGCPIKFNHLIGDAYVKLASGFAASLKAESVPDIGGASTQCEPDAAVSTLRLDGISYGRIARALGVSSLPSSEDGNQTLLVIDRIGGDLTFRAQAIGSVFGVVYDDLERGHSFEFSEASCQLSRTLRDSFPRTSPSYSEVIPAGRTGWMKMWLTSDGGLTGAVIVQNSEFATSPTAFNQGRNLHHLTLASAVSLIIPVYPPGC